MITTCDVRYSGRRQPGRAVLGRKPGAIRSLSLTTRIRGEGLRHSAACRASAPTGAPTSGGHGSTRPLQPSRVPSGNRCASGAAATDAGMAQPHTHASGDEGAANMNVESGGAQFAEPPDPNGFRSSRRRRRPYCSLAYSALASFWIGIFASASFQRVRKSL